MKSGELARRVNYFTKHLSEAGYGGPQSRKWGVRLAIKDIADSIQLDDPGGVRTDRELKTIKRRNEIWQSN